MWQGQIISPDLSLLTLSPVIRSIHMNAGNETSPDFNGIFFQDIRFFDDLCVAIISVDTLTHKKFVFKKVLPIDSYTEYYGWFWLTSNNVWLMIGVLVIKQGCFPAKDIFSVFVS